jgi:hypothetical protein
MVSRRPGVLRSRLSKTSARAQSRKITFGNPSASLIEDLG